MNNYKIYTNLYLLGIIFLLSSCLGDLDSLPLDPDEITSGVVYENPEAYKQVLAKIYAGLALSGQQGPAGQPDISGIDEGFSTYLRQYWKAQELSTDEAVIAWNDGNIHDYHEQDWDSNNEFVAAMYNRIFYQVVLCNELLRETTADKLTDRGVTDELRAEIDFFRAEARFMRALSYWHALDMFRSVPFVTEEDVVGSFFPEQSSKEDLYNYIESELLDIETRMMGAGQNEYGRADQGAVWMLLSKLYLNTEVYLGSGKYDEAITYLNLLLEAGYSLDSKYENLFLADNNLSPEAIFSINFDGLRSQTWGGMTFLCHASVGGTMDPAKFGIDGGWAGARTTSALVNKFDVENDTLEGGDSRAMFHTDGQLLEIETISEFTEGYGITKFKNVTSDGSVGSDLTFVDTDFHLFRLGDVYLMYAEAVLRGGNGDMGTAVSLVNDLRERARGNSDGNITTADLTLDFILDERARELYWECHRRTDLIRFGKFSESNYVWPWKGGAKEGISTASYLNVFPIPSSDLVANPELQQNPGY